MVKAINMPKMGNTVESVIVGDINIKVGDTIKKDQVLFSYETDKSTTEYKSEEEGKVQAILMESGQEIPVLVPIIVLGEDGEDISEFTAKKEEEKEEEKEVKDSSVNNNVSGFNANGSKMTEEQPRMVSSSNEASSLSGKSSPRARSTAASLGLDISTIKGNGINGMTIEKDVLSFFHSDGSLVKDYGSNGNFEYKELLIKAIAKELGVDIAINDQTQKKIKDQSQNGEHYEDKKETFTNANLRPKASKSKVPNGATRVEFSPVRTAIASTMMSSLSEAAQLTMGIEIDATALLNARAKIKKLAAVEKHANSSVNDIIIFALSRVLPKHPHINSHVGDDYLDQFETSHISVAVDTPAGLFVPVVKDATNKSLCEITKDTKEIVKKAQDGKLTPSDMANGTFTISNLGLSGVSFFTPVLNPPQAGLLGVGSPVKRLKFDKNNKVVEYPEITLSLTMDHRPFDGIAGTAFAKDMKYTLENIEEILDF